MVSRHRGEHHAGIINRHYDESVLSVLGELRRDATYSCSDPRMHIKERVSVTKLSNTAAERHNEDFENLHDTIDDYLTHYGCIPYCVVLQLLAMRYLGAGLLDSDFVDKNYPYRSSKSFSCMFWLWKIGNDQDLQRIHFLNIWRSTELISTLTSTITTADWRQTPLQQLLCECYEESEITSFHEL